MIYLLHPDLWELDTQRAADFMDLVAAELSTRDALSILYHPSQLAATTLGPSDAVVINNENSDHLPAPVLEFLERATQANAQIFPFAFSPDVRIPPGIITARQSFDITERQRLFAYADHILTPIAQQFAREILAATLPTLYRVRGRLFLSHRRIDGETIAAEIDAQLSQQHHDIFRDLLDIPAGDNADAIIDAELPKSDAVVYLETPQAGLSPAVERELALAYSHDIPIAWIRIPIDDQPFEDSRFIPGIPDLVCSKAEIEDDPPAAAARILDAAFEVVDRRAISTLRSLRELEQQAPQANVAVRSLDKRRLIHEVSPPRHGAVISSPTERHIVQIFGRTADATDHDTLAQWLVDNNELTPDRQRCFADALIVGGPSTSGAVPSEQHPRLSEWRLDAYVEAVLRRPSTGDGPVGPGLFISGAFPDNRMADDEVMRALTHAAREWMLTDGVVVSGGHPTFTPVLVQIAKELNPTNPGRNLVIYQSDFFTTNDSDPALGQGATVIRTRSQGDRERSLELMRTRILEHVGLAAVLLIGGRPEDPERPAGVRLEFDMARDFAIPVIPLGAPGGETSRIVDEIDKTALQWHVLTRPPITGDWLRRASRRTDYRGIVRELHRQLTT